MPRRAVLFASGPIADYGWARGLLSADDFIAVADGGLRHAQALGLTPDLAVGDFDSAGLAARDALLAAGVPVITAPCEKDQTDTHLALDELLTRGAEEIWLLGASGGRLDHTLANLLLLPGVPPGVRVVLADEHGELHLLRDGQVIQFAGRPGWFLSLLPLSPVCTGVKVSGVKWPLAGASLTWGSSLGVSNQITAADAEVSVEQGTLLAILARD